ncbi:hypothetical protein ACV3R1_13445 [Clostridium perfringens]|nr:hypothetical protein [Clostridium perfringens]
MDKKKLNYLIKNFSSDDWIKGKLKNENVLIYNDDFNLTLQLKEKHLREDDEFLNGYVYDDVFKKYNIEFIVSVKAFFKEIELKDIYIFSLLKNGDTIIPVPAIADQTNQFYRDELEMAKMFSDDRFNVLINDPIIIDKK